VDRCEECGFIYDDLPVTEVHSRLRAGPGRYRRALAQVGEEAARHRPRPGVWSALEYTCHVRDVLLVQRDRTVQALVETNPGFARMHRDERVSLARYDAHPSPVVAGQLEMAAELCATVFEGLTADQWARPLIYNYPAPSPRDLAWLARNTVHEVEHHLGDIRTVIAQVTATSPDRGRRT
jgi:S-DNA-T family DNA segregation ATPase FtsK/SpoIIIE